MVEWEDAWGTSGWNDMENAKKAHKPMVVTSVGFVVVSDGEGVSLAQGFDHNNNPCGVHFVPKKMIKKITKVKY